MSSIHTIDAIEYHLEEIERAAKATPVYSAAGKFTFEDIVGKHFPMIRELIDVLRLGATGAPVGQPSRNERTDWQAAVVEAHALLAKDIELELDESGVRPGRMARVALAFHRLGQVLYFNGIDPSEPGESVRHLDPDASPPDLIKNIDGKHVTITGFDREVSGTAEYSGKVLGSGEPATYEFTVHFDQPAEPETTTDPNDAVRQAVASALRQCEWGSLKGPNDVPGMWLYLADAAIKAYEKATQS